MKVIRVFVVLFLMWLGSSAAGATVAPRPPTAVLKTKATVVGAAGGVVDVGLRVTRASTCTFSADPTIARFAARVRCLTTMRRAARIPVNRTVSAREFLISIVVRGPGGAVRRREVVRQVGRTTAAGESPIPGESPVPGESTVPGQWWVPPLHVEWQWELDHPLNLASKTDMGIGDVTYTGAPAPTPTVYDIDGDDNPASTVAALHALGDRVICYMEVGAAENYRSDYAEFPAADLGNTMPGYPDERYLNINAPAVLPIIEARIKNCATKGFDAVEPDIDDSYTDSTGFAITESENIAYDTTLAAYAHSLGLGWALKNGDTEDGFAAAMLPHVDFVIDEQCFQYNTCAAFSPSFTDAGKAVLEVEYSDQGGPSPSSYCPRAIADGFNSVEFDSNLDGKVRLPCS